MNNNDVWKLITTLIKDNLESFASDIAFYREVMETFSKLVPPEKFYILIKTYIDEMDRLNLELNKKENVILKSFYKYLYTDNYTYLKSIEMNKMQKRLFSKMQGINSFDQLFENSDSDLILEDMLKNEILFLNQNGIQKEIRDVSLSDKDVLQINKINPDFKEEQVFNRFYFLHDYVASEAMDQNELKRYLSIMKCNHKEIYSKIVREMFSFNQRWCKFINDKKLLEDQSEENNFMQICSFYNEDDYIALMDDDQVFYLVLEVFRKIRLYKKDNSKNSEINEQKVRAYYNKEV